MKAINNNNNRVGFRQTTGGRHRILLEIHPLRGFLADMMVKPQAGDIVFYMTSIPLRGFLAEPQAGDIVFYMTSIRLVDF